MQFRPDGNLYFLLIYSFTFLFLTQLQTAFIIGTSYAIAKLAPKRQLAMINQLDEDEKNALIKIINSMLTKKRMKDLLDGKVKLAL